MWGPGCNGLPASKSSKGKTGREWKALFFILAGLVPAFYAGCASVPSRHFRQQLGPPIPFQELLEAEAPRHERVLLGGYLLETANESDGTRLTLLQAPLDSRNKPKSQDLSQGRFVVQTDRFLDPAIYTKGRKVTVGGKVWGTMPQPLGNLTYEYPLIKAEELHLWPKERPYTRPYYPYYNYWYSPWYRYPYYRYPWYPW